MAYAHVDLVATAGQQNFSFSIPYLSQNDITVFKNGTLLATPADWTFLSAQVVRLTVGAAVNDIIRIRRTTPINTAIVDYANGSVLGETQLDATALQSLFAAQEVADSLVGAITQNQFLQWDAQNLPIINIPVSSIPSSVVRRDFADSQVAAAAASASAASGSASSASTSASNAATSASTASASATSAATSETNAAASAAKLKGTSTTSLLIAAASKVFTTQAGKSFEEGAWLLITSDANEANYMHGQSTAYSDTSLTVNVTNIGGSGTFADWTIRVAGTRGAIGATGGTAAAGDTVVNETAFGIASTAGASPDYSRKDHTHGTPTNPVTAHEAAGDPHIGYQRESEKDAASGYAGLTTGSKIKTDVVETASITNAAVTFAKFQDVSSHHLIGRDSLGTSGPISEILPQGGIETNSGILQIVAFTGDVSKDTGGTVLTIASDAVTYAKMQNVAAASKLLGRGSAGGAGDPEEITLGTNLSMSGTTLNATGGGGGGDSLIYEFW